MADEPVGSSSRTWLLIVALVAVAIVAWWLIGRGGEEDVETTYEAGVEDLSGGELIVREADEPGVPVDVPETPMTNVPAQESGESAPPSAE